MKEIHELLQSQLAEHFGTSERVPESLQSFIDTINNTYWRNGVHNSRNGHAELGSFLTGLYENTGDGIIVLDRNFTVIEVNPAVLARHQGVKSIIGGKCYEAILGRNEVCRNCPVAYTFRTGEPKRTVAPKIDHERRMSGWLEIDSFPLTSLETGEVTGAVEHVRDVSEGKAAEEALKQSEELYRAFFENTGTAAIVVDTDGTITLANSGFEKLSGFSRKELELKKLWTDFFSPDDLPRNGEPDADRDGFPESPVSYECEFIGRDGIPKTCINNLRTIPGTGQLIASVLDVSDVKRLQSQLIHAEKMEAIGALAGGIAHDFNNLLMSIQGYTSLLLLDNSLDSSSYSRLKSIEEHVRSGADLTRQLLGYAQGGKYQVRPINLNDVVDKTAAMFGRTKKEIAIHNTFQDNLWIVEADRGEIERVLLNLFVNAWQAMPGGGDLYLATKNVVLDTKYTRPYGLSAGRYVVVSATDTGTGMDEKTRDRIFEPFFTTREMGRGTGLGLASAYGIIKGHGGIINVYSEKGKGSTFNIYLPASRKRKSAEERAPQEEVVRGTEGVLLIDDEPSILDIGKQILELLGYRVFTAGTGMEAIELFRRHSAEVEVVVLDMIMPQMGGGETFDRLKSIDPAVRVILSSGYSMTGEADEIVERGCRGFIQKPFTPVELSRKIREALTDP
jgi:two-component system, cell cycle sensor histidine kinase and response regulator CckA